MIMKKKLVSLLLTFCMVMTIIPSTLIPSSAEFIDNGQCGENVYYQLYSNGDLVISGNGPMYQWNFEPMAPNFNQSPFNGSSAIKSIYVEDGVTSIGINAFMSCKNLTYVKTASSVKYINSGAFDFCNNLTSVDFAEGVLFIGNAFNCCEMLKELFIPASVKKITFDKNFNYKILTISPKNNYYCIENNVLYNRDKTILIRFLSDNTVHEYHVPASVKKIGTHAFTDSKIENLYLSSGLTEIGTYAFCNCSYLTYVNLPEGLTDIKECAFVGCSSLKNINLPEGLKTIGYNAFQSCSSLEKVIFPDSLSEIGHYSFANCYNLKEIKIPANVTSIGGSAFCNCENLSSVTTVENNSIKKVGINVFENTPFQENQSGTFIYLDNILLKECDDYNSVPCNIEIKYGTEIIADSAFSDNFMIETVSLPETIKRIGDYAFKNCTSLKQINIPSSVTSIGNGVFSGCSSLNDIFISENNNIEEAGNFIESSKFYNDLTDGIFYAGDVLVTGKNIKDSHVEIRQGTKVIANEAFYGSKIKSIEIPQGVKYIGQGAFSENWDLNKINLPDSVTFLGACAFFKCFNLKEINLSENLLEIGDECFNLCRSLKTIRIPENIKNIGRYAFSENYAMENIIIESNNISISPYAFNKCLDLKNINFNGSEKQWYSNDIKEGNDYLFFTDICFNSSDNETPDKDLFYKNSYIADLWLKPCSDKKNSPLMYSADNIMGITSFSSGLYDSLSGDPAFMIPYDVKNNLNLIFNFPDEIQKRSLQKSELYETLILQLVKGVMEQNISDDEKAIRKMLDEASNSGFDLISNLNKGSGYVEKALKVSDAGDYKELLKGWLNNPDSESFKEFKKSIKYDEFSANLWGDTAFVKAVSNVADVTNDIQEFLDKYKLLCYAANMGSEMKDFLMELYNNTSDNDIKTAANKVISAFNDIDYSLCISITESTDKVLIDLGGKMFGIVANEIPIYSQLSKFYKSMDAFTNVIFNTKKILGKYMLCGVTKDFFDLCKKTVKTLKNRYLSSGYEKDATLFVYAFNCLEQVFILDHNSASQFTKAADEEGLINKVQNLPNDIAEFLGFNNGDSRYEKLCNNFDNIQSCLRDSFEYMNNAWKFDTAFLKEDYPEIYPDIINEEFQKDYNVPVITNAEIRKDGKTEISYRIPYKHQSTEYIEGLHCEEEIENIAKHQKDFSNEAVGTFTMYDHNTFTSFNKIYRLCYYTNTVQGNKYSKFTKATVKNPIKAPLVYIPSPSGTLEIFNLTSRYYDNIYFEIYCNGVKTATVTKKSTERFSEYKITSPGTYKVRACCNFSNGQTLYSNFSISLKYSGKTQITPININTKYVRANKSNVPKLSSRTRTVSQSVFYNELNWDRSDQAVNYEIYRKCSYGDKYIKLAETETPHYIDNTACYGYTYEYYVIPCINSDSGEKVQLADSIATGEKISEPEITLISGDINGDGEVTSSDARLALRASVSLEKLTRAETEAADADNNGEITSADARLILRRSVDL